MATILVKEITEGCMPKIIEQGDWIDLYAAEDIEMDFSEKQLVLVKLGVAMKIPAGYEAIIAPRSSSYKNFRILQTNSIGVVDNSYCGDTDEWRMPITTNTGKVSIKKGERICQFRIQLTQKATAWQKMCWLFDGTLKLKKVSTLNSASRGGFGSTGK